MKKHLWKVLCGVLVVVFAVSCMATLFACDKKPTGDDTEVTGPTGTLVVGYNNFEEKFSPFFATNAYDVDVAGMTQVALLASDRGGNIIKKGIEGEKVVYNGTEYTYYGLSNLTITKNNDGTVDYAIQMRKDVKFSDGTPLTIKDVIFNMYVFSDTDYDGSTTFYSLPIQGMSEWRTNLTSDILANVTAVSEAILATYSKEAKGYVCDEAATAYTKAQFDSLTGKFDAVYVDLAKDIVDYVANKYYADNGKGGNKYSGKSGVDLSVLGQKVAFGMAVWGFGSFDSDYVADENGNVGKIGEDYKNLWTTTDKEDEASFADPEGKLYKRVSGKDDAAFTLNGKNEDGTYNVLAYEGDRYAQAFVDTFTDGNGKNYTMKDNDVPTYADYAACIKDAYAGDVVKASDTEKANTDFASVAIQNWIAEEGAVQMNGKSINSISGITYNEEAYTINVKTTEFSATTIYNLSLAIAPMAYYGDTKLWDPANGSYGFTRGNLNGVREKTTKPMGAGPYKYVSYKDGIVTFEANELYWEGCPKIKNIMFKEMADADKLPAVVKGDIDIANPSISDDVVSQIKKANNGDARLAIAADLKVATDLVDNNGYGYIGMNADVVKVGTDKSSEASKNLRKGFATLFAAYREYTVNSYYHERASVIQYPISNCSWAAPQPADTGYAIAYSKDVDGNEIYTADMTEEQRWAAAKEAFIGFLKKAGYTWDDAAKKFTAAPEGAEMGYEVIVGGDGKGDHPNFALLIKCEEVWDSVGLKLTITDDSDNLFKRVQEGTVPMFTLAWGGSADPDMYQIYHSDNKTGSNHYRIADAELDQLIIQARQSEDNTYRKGMYKKCLDIILDWGVEVPVYQRKNGYVFNTDAVKVETITPDTTPYWTYMSEIHKLEVKD